MSKWLDVDPERFEDGKVETVGDKVTGKRYRLHMYSPSFGGYVGRLFIEVPTETDSTCFEGKIFHDGEGPVGYGFGFHCCDAMQFVQFGLDLHNKLCKLQRGDIDREYLLRLRAQIDKMLESEPSSGNPH